MRKVCLLVVLGLALVPAAEARNGKLTMRTARASIAKLGRDDVRRGDATGYTVRECRRRSRTRIACVLREQGVLLVLDLGGERQDEMDFLAVSRKGHLACLPEMAGPDGC